MGKVILAGQRSNSSHFAAADAFALHFKEDPFYRSAFEAIMAQSTTCSSLWRMQAGKKWTQ